MVADHSHRIHYQLFTTKRGNIDQGKSSNRISNTVIPMLKFVYSHVLPNRQRRRYGDWDFDAFLGIHLLLSFSFRCNS